MSDTSLRVLIVGGYGVFGSRLVQLLSDEARLTLIVAGRSAARAKSLCATIGGDATLIATAFDRNGNLSAQIEQIGPDIIVDASGPFQGYGDDPYRVVRAALKLGIHYMDLADASGFVEGIVQFDAEAKKRGLFLLSGVSSFPVLTAAVVRHLAQGLARVDTITGGIAPSPYAGVGPNVIRAISSYAGKSVPLTRNGQPSTGHGLAETRRYTICPPGRLPLGNRLFSLVDVPDLHVLPQQWPGLRAIWIGAGPVPEILHFGLNLLASSVRFKLLPSLSFLAPIFHRAMNILQWGEHRGGMFVSIEGVTENGTHTTRSWHLHAEGDDGPLIPSMAIEAIIRKCLSNAYPPAGARPAVAELELADYDAMFQRRKIFTGTRARITATDEPVLYKRVLGDSWNQLPLQIREMHEFSGAQTAEGSAEVTRGRNILSRLIGWVFRFPQQGRDLPVQVKFTSDGDRETWTRQFGTHSFSSHQVEGKGRSDRLVEEIFGPFSFGLALVVSEQRLSFVVRRWTFFGLPMPTALAPSGNSFESAVDGRFQFHVEICMPLIGLIVRYVGNLQPVKG